MPDPTGNATHCTNGHRYTPANTYYRGDGTRRCRACAQANAAKYKEPNATCAHGHVYAEVGYTRTASGKRQCNVCEAQRAERRQERDEAAARRRAVNQGGWHTTQGCIPVGQTKVRCSGCDQTFASEQARAEHLIGDMCIDPAAAGLEQDAFGRWRFSFSAAVVRGAVRAFQELVEMGVLP